MDDDLRAVITNLFRKTKYLPLAACMQSTPTRMHGKHTHTQTPTLHTQLNALSAALARRSEEAAANAEAHRAALGSLALARALGEGKPLHHHLQVRSSFCQLCVCVYFVCVWEWCFSLLRIIAAALP